jgi:hypothetical protein
MPDRPDAPLTAEEWAGRDYRQPARAIDEWAHAKPEQRDSDDPTEYVAKLGLTYDDCVVAMNRAHDRVLIPPPARAALAAFALLDRPFGFGRGDVDALRAAAALPGADAAALTSLADRLEALLPPHG